MKILKAICWSVLLLFVFCGRSNAQNGDNELIVKQLKSESFTEAKIPSPVAPQTFKGVDANGPWQMTLKRQDFESAKRGKAFVYVSEFSQKGKVSSYTLAENGTSVYRVQHGSVNKMKSRKSGRLDRFNACLKNLATKCVACYKALISCTSGASDSTIWSFYACLGETLVGKSCTPCYINTLELLTCMLEAW